MRFACSGIGNRFRLDHVLGLSLSTLPSTAAEQEAIDEALAESDAEVGTMPESEGMIVAVNAGAVTADFYEDQADIPDFKAGLAMMRLVMSSEDDAAQAIAVVEHRWQSMSSLYTQQPFTGIMEIDSTAVDGDVAEIDFVQVRSPKIWWSSRISCHS